MFEFHGWATITVDDRDDPEMSVIERRQEDAIARLRVAMQLADDQFSLFDLKRTSNRLLVLYAHGLRNHRYEPVIELFRWVASELPFSYGLLYVHDDEDQKRGANLENDFRVWRLARGEFSEFSDPFLSPFIPTVEPPWEWPDTGDASIRPLKERAYECAKFLVLDFNTPLDGPSSSDTTSAPSQSV